MSNDNKLRALIEYLKQMKTQPATVLAPNDPVLKAHVAQIDEWIEVLATTSEKPAAAAERGAVGLTVWKGDVAELAVQHGIYREPDEEDVQAFAKAVLAAATVNATPPAQAAEPAQVDEPTDEEVAEAIEACFSAEHEWPEGDGATVRAFLKYSAGAKP